MSLTKDALRKTGLFALAKDTYAALGGTIYRPDGEWLDRTFGEQPISFIQIGAHDGKTHDSLYPRATTRGWRGVVVEPVKYLFDRLVENYRGFDRISCVNAAIAAIPGKRPFYRMKPCDDPALPKWYDQIGSFNLETVLSHRHAIPNIDELIVEEEVECLTFAQLATRYDVDPDLILTDAEGYDLTILRSIDLARYRPRVIIYEHKHLSERERKAAHALLRFHQYTVYPTGNNNAAIRSRYYPPVSRRMP